MEYLDFLKTKIDIAEDSGFIVDPFDINPALKPHQRDAVVWALRGGRRAVFASFGLGKTNVQIEFCHQVVKKFGGKALIVCPLGVKQEFTHDAIELLHYEPPAYVRNMEEIRSCDSEILITNYERVRDGDIDPTYFLATSLDEASVLRSFGSKTYQTFLDKFKGVPYKLVATATPSPNKYKELIHYSGYLEIMDTGSALTRFFQRDSTKANNLTLYPTQEDKFWLWVSSWALFITKPSDLNPDYSDDGYVLPPLEVRWHELPINYGDAVDRDGQISLFTEATTGLKEAAHVKRESIDRRVAKMKEIVDESPDDHFILWHDLEDERHAIKKALPDTVDIYGSQDYEIREKRVIDFSEGRIRLFATKKELSGSGCNFQRFCHRAIFLGIDYEFNDFIQACHRIYRFLQNEQVVIDIIYMENEREIKDALLEKWKNHNHMVERMIEIVKKYGLSTANKEGSLERKLGVKNVRVEGKRYIAVNDDCIAETRKMESNSIGLIHTSVPFGNHYEYSNQYEDLGFNAGNKEFFQQMDYLTPELYRILKPGRIAAIHVKDRVLFGNATGTGMPTIDPFHVYCIEHYMKHGFQYCGMITVVTDVVRENNQTYRLGWTEQCKDGSKMGVGCPEYILLFRKLPTDRSKAYADEPVTKTKEEYTRAQWQIDAHAYWRSSGDRLVSKDELKELSVDSLQKVYREYSRNTVYNYKEHVELAKSLDERGKLPAIFMVVAPGSWTDEVWDDINRMRTLNTNQSRRRQQMHVCLAKGSLVLTRDGYKPIEDIEIGDMVLTHKGNWKPVIAKKCTGVNDVIETIAPGVPGLVTTPDHKLWTRFRKDGQNPIFPELEGCELTDPEWIEAQNATDGYVNLKLPKIEKSALSDEDWYIVGRYLADCDSITHDDIKGNEELLKMLKKCDCGKYGMQVPIEGLCLNRDQAYCIIEGYLSEFLKTFKFPGRALFLGMSMLQQRTYGDPLYFNKTGDSVMPFSDLDKFVNVIDGAWKRVLETRKAGKTETWSIQVADDASFTAEGCIVKNCPLQIDIVERIINRFSSEGDTVYDPFGGLMTVPMVAVKMGRFGIGCELNADYFRDGVGYLQAAEMEAETPTLFDFMDMKNENE